MVRLLIILGILCPFSVFGQSFINIRILKEEEKIIVIYDLVNEERGSKVVVSVYGSHNNFSTPITDVTGDVGEVLPGPNRRIEWASETALKSFSNNFTFQFKGEVIHGWKFIKPDNGKLKRGKKHLLKWQGGHPYDTVTLKLISPSRNVMEIVKTKNTGSYLWKVPKEIVAKPGFALSISCGKEVYEQKIVIKRKFPLLILAIPVTGVAIFFGVSNTESSRPANLPDAPKPN